MAPATHHEFYRHYSYSREHSKDLTVTAAHHHGAHEVTSVYAIPTGYPSPNANPSSNLLSLSSSSPTALPSLTPNPAPSPPPAFTTLPNTSWGRSQLRYPRASPPSFLYPRPIGPPQVYESSMQHAVAPEPSSATSGAMAGQAGAEGSAKPTDIDIWLWLGLLGFVVTTLAGCWSFIVAAIHHRGLTMGMEPRVQRVVKRQQNEDDDKGEQDDRQEKTQDGWWGWVRDLNSFTAFRKAKYEAVRTENFGLEDRPAAFSSALDIPTRLQGLSPENPFLVPTGMRSEAIRPRGSAEWAEQHRAFFASTSSETSTSTPAECIQSHSLSGAEPACVEFEAREAQDRRGSVADNIENAMLAREQRSWVDLGLAAVDGAVDRFAAKIVRWTNDGGSDEELVLPLAKGKME